MPANAPAFGRSNGGNIAADSGRHTLPSSAARRLQNQSKRGVFGPSAQPRIAGLPSARRTPQHCCPGAQSIWRSAPARPHRPRSQPQYPTARDSPGNRHPRRPPVRVSLRYAANLEPFSPHTSSPTPLRKKRGMFLLARCAHLKTASRRLFDSLCSICVCTQYCAFFCANPGRIITACE